MSECSSPRFLLQLLTHRQSDEFLDETWGERMTRWNWHWLVNMAEEARDDGEERKARSESEAFNSGTTASLWRQHPSRR